MTRPHNATGQERPQRACDLCSVQQKAPDLRALTGCIFCGVSQSPNLPIQEIGVSGATYKGSRQQARRLVGWITAGYRPIAFIPLLLAATHWAAGEQTMIAVAAVLPAAAVLLSLFPERRFTSQSVFAAPFPIEAAEAWLQGQFSVEGRELRQIAVMAIKFDSLDLLEERLGFPMDDTIVEEFSNRLGKILRQGDLIARGKKSDILVCLGGMQAPESENLLHLSRRIQTCLDEPITKGAVRVYCSVTVGIARASQIENLTPSALIRAADCANRSAIQDGPGVVRIYKTGYGKVPSNDNVLLGEVAAALENGQIIAWYQPQVSTHTGEITGFEALARWEHPTRGLISPASFLGLIDRLGLSQRLSEVVLTHALSTLRTCDRAGFGIPSVSVNYCSDELRNPRLAEFLRWELDRFELTADRLTIEVLENVIAESQDDIISQNLRAISEMGCHIDLDDFGTSYTSIMNIRKFSVSRLKIDRQLISRVDSDAEQRKLVSALLAMAEQLDIETLAEGVETPAEHSMLAQLGCDHIQGFNLARPMPRGDSLTWIADYRSGFPTQAQVGKKPAGNNEVT
ncbi:Phytochrome-like protein cph2 [Boseongicola aestuarii]|uniref:Phytochrome-like protein cph2 n=1 Tax=Boseongicola aestuarii TaxID=1470561 RepID=A0A238J4Y3_9RHOB|nr:Phytochrome-like protein cph2 [Boseongicola aestuarii]